tara:strand:- start:3284 stop:4528 length:1245 start_codon:yes stop_codon:yes gene_type:complete
MLRTADNVFSVILDAESALASGLPGAGTVVTDANLAKGAICVVNAGMERLNKTEYDKVDRYKIVQGKGVGKPLMMSPMITKATATVSTSKHRLPLQQVSIVGFNGSTGSLPAANETDFYIKIRKNDNDAANRSQPMSLFAGPVRTDATASQEELAFALVKNGQTNFAKEPANNYLAFDIISDGTTAAISGSPTLAATKGSVSLTYNGNHSLAGGDLVFIAGATYKVESAPTATTVTLTTPFEGETVTALASGTTYATTHGKLTAAVNFGVRLTGVQADFDVNAMRDYYVNRFTVTFSDASTLVTTTGARTGSGVWQQVAMDEYMNYGYEGMDGMLGVPPRMRDQEVVEGQKYGCMEISWTESIQGLVSLQGGKGSVLVYCALDKDGDFPTGADKTTGEELVVTTFDNAKGDFEL